MFLYFFQSPTFCLRHKQAGKDAAEKAESAEKPERPVIGERKSEVFELFGDQEYKNPGDTPRQTIDQTAHPRWNDFRNDERRNGSPTEREERHIDQDARKRQPAQAV